MATKLQVFLSHNSADKPAVEHIAARLLNEPDIEPWLDKWNLVPGDPWQEELERVICACDSCAIFVGQEGLGPWHHEEMRSLISRRVSERQRRFRVIPVLLPGAAHEEPAKLPPFLAATLWVEFRGSLDDPEAYYRLGCGIRGNHPVHRNRRKGSRRFRVHSNKRYAEDPSFPLTRPGRQGGGRSHCPAPHWRRRR